MFYFLSLLPAAKKKNTFIARSNLQHSRSDNYLQVVADVSENLRTPQMILHCSRAARIRPDTRVQPSFVRLSTIELPAVLNKLRNIFHVPLFVLFIFLLISYI